MSNQIQQAVAIQKEMIQRQIDRNRHSIVLNQIKQVKDQLMKKCILCDYTGTKDDILKHMKNSHKEDFLTMGDNINKYSMCRVCKKLFKNKNIEEHQLKCELKEDNKKAAREKNKVRNLKRTNQYCQEISEEKQEEEHDNLLKEFGVGIEDNSNHIIQSQESNQSESELRTSILNSKLFQTKKKLKTNEDNDLTFQTHEKDSIKTTYQEQKKSSIDKFVAAEALARENKIKEIKQENERVERKSIIERSRSRDKSLRQKQIIKQTQQKLKETAEQTQKKELEATINKLKQQQQINKKNLDKLNNKQILDYYNEMKQNDFVKILEKTNHEEKDALIKFLQMKDITKNSFRKPKNKDMSQAMQNIITIQNITHKQIQHELDQLQNQTDQVKQKQIVPKDSEEEKEQKEAKELDSEIKQKAKELDSQIKKIQEEINKLKQQKQQFPDDIDVIEKEIFNQFSKKDYLKSNRI
ncbi:hypothetical protein ABPG72_010356 [Tetrahymena utriculariae]